MAEDDKPEEQSQEKEVCGLIMPISPTEGYPPTHWEQVKLILEEVIDSAGFKSNMVSDADDVGIIHNRIVGNLGENPIVVCDVSSKNPNVMFELGLRLAFDKPTIIVKDNITNYNFDTSPIEHVGYPVDLNYHSINTFKKVLRSKLEGTYKASKQDPNYSTFLKHFVQYKRKLDEKVVGTEELILKKMDQMNSRISSLQNQFGQTRSSGISIFNSLSEGYELFKLFGEGNEKDSARQIKIKFRKFLEKYDPRLLETLINEPEKYHRVEADIINHTFFSKSSNSNELKGSLLDALREKYGDRYDIDEYKEGQ